LAVHRSIAPSAEINLTSPAPAGLFTATAGIERILVFILHRKQTLDKSSRWRSSCGGKSLACPAKIDKNILFLAGYFFRLPYTEAVFFCLFKDMTSSSPERHKTPHLVNGLY
jgi:hypothetical protein